jgi:hypothetical protein
LSYRGFLNHNRDIIIASLIPLTSSSKWQSYDITWYKRFINVASELLEPNTFIALKEKVRLFFILQSMGNS